MASTHDLLQPSLGGYLAPSIDIAGVRARLTRSLVGANTWHLRVAGIVLSLTVLWQAQWMIRSIDLGVAWLAIPFGAANLLTMLGSLVLVVNNWQRFAPAECLVPRGSEPAVAVIIPTCGEPVEMLVGTIESVLWQDWPSEQLLIIVSDDAHRPEIAEFTQRLQNEYRNTTLIYHEPPAAGSARRRGDAKAGNLNSALELIASEFAFIAYIETRDADDEVGDARFLRQCVGQLATDRELAFVQTIKEARVSRGDPFNNLEPIFYRELMLARNATNSVFPCGSGLVWRRSAVESIGGFPTWNLVEDLQSGVEALRRGWRGLFLPIVGAMAQHAPEDLPNVYKQRGTWALDTMRLLLWGDQRGLSLRQRLHFAEMGLFYLLGPIMFIFMTIPLVDLVFHVYPLASDSLAYPVHLVPYAAALEWYLAVWRGRRPYSDLWRARQLWWGLLPVYASACVLALLGGPNRKPVYRVTRKVSYIGWYWRETLIHLTVVTLLALAVMYGLASSAPTWSTESTFETGSAFWAGLFIIFLASFIRMGWYGVDVRTAALRRMRVYARRNR